MNFGKWAEKAASCIMMTATTNPPKRKQQTPGTGHKRQTKEVTHPK
jgi:hypothetical protein